MKFDLTTQSFMMGLPAGSGATHGYSLYDAIAEAHEIKHIRGDSPFQTAALMRLLTAFTRRCYGLGDSERWHEIWRAGRFPVADLRAYLDRPQCAGKFDLASVTAPFYQCAGLVTKDEVTLNRLAFDATSGNNATLFDHSLDDRLPTYSAAHAARLLVTAQAFAPSGGRGTTAKVDGLSVDTPYLADGPARSGISYWFEGENLFQTIMLASPDNAGEHREDDAPWWEYGDWPSLLAQHTVGRSRAADYPRGLCDRLTFQCRLIRLLWREDEHSGDPVCSTMYCTQGRTISSQTGDPFKAERKGKENWFPISVNPVKAGWRDLHAILRTDPRNVRRPDVVRFAESLAYQGLISDHGIVLNCAGAASDQAKIVLWRHDRFEIPRKLLTDDTAQGRVEAATAIAERRADAMQSELKAIIRIYVAPDHVGVDGKKNLSARQPEEKDVSALFSQIDPREQYWSALEIWFAELLQALGDPERNENALSGWRARVEREKESAMATAIDALGQGPRAWRARGKFEAVRRSTEQKAATSIGNGRE